VVVATLRDAKVSMEHVRPMLLAGSSAKVCGGLSRITRSHSYSVAVVAVTMVMSGGDEYDGRDVGITDMSAPVLGLATATGTSKHAVPVRGLASATGAGEHEDDTA